MKCYTKIDICQGQGHNPPLILSTYKIPTSSLPSWGIELTTLRLKRLVLYRLSQEGLAKLINIIAFCCYGCSHMCWAQLIAFFLTKHIPQCSVGTLCELLLFMYSINPSSPSNQPWHSPYFLSAVPCWSASALPRYTIRAFSYPGYY